MKLFTFYYDNLAKRKEVIFAITRNTLNKRGWYGLFYWVLTDKGEIDASDYHKGNIRAVAVNGKKTVKRYDDEIDIKLIDNPNPYQKRFILQVF